MMNWPTAFVIAVAICAGGFLYNKPSDAAFGGSDRYSIRINDYWVQFDAINRGCVCPNSKATVSRLLNATPGKLTDD